ncbi:iron-sulfur cluster-binding domain-containing protein [Sphingosinicella soli]|uniref:flavin reductase family protein n=1 Tax=Sphingosinicella soli TaxID=333708 RepID=UPI00311CD588
MRLGDADDAPVRSWTLSDHDDAPDHYRLTVKRLAGGTGSARLHEIGARGGTVWLRPPSGRFTLKRDGFMRVVLISAGIGVTPMLAMLKAHRARRDSPPPLVWIHQARSGETHVFAAAAKDAALAHVFYSAPRESDAGHEAGRLGAERLREILAPAYTTSPFGREIELPGIYSDVYVCGPAPFEAMVRDALTAMGVPPGQIRSESFVPAAQPEPVIAQARVDFGGVIAQWTESANPSLLELAETAGLAPGFGCRSGSCGACESTLVSGSVEHSPSPAIPLAAGRILLCCARPASDVVIALD